MTTTQPTNASEWQLYRVLQRANLLQYYDTFVAQGGDDVQQLCEAGEEEFLEIMALVGMASKPLHVRRLQKALQEWVANPGAFQGNGNSAMFKREPPTQVYSLPSAGTDNASPTPWAVQQVPQKSTSPVSMVASSRPLDLQPEMTAVSPLQIKKSTSPQPGSCSQPVLLENQINEIAKCAAKLAGQLPYFATKSLNMKKEVNKQIYDLIELEKDHPDRLELMRKYGAIYRRFDSQRAYGKPMSMHEICVNEASAQLCYHMPSLLTRREDLFPLARQVVKDSGYQYSKGHSRAGDLCPNNPSKRQKLDFLGTVPGFGSSEAERTEREERLKAISKELSEISSSQEQIVNELDGAKDDQDTERQETLQTQLEQITNKHLTLLTEQNELLRKQSYEVYVDVDASSDREDSNLVASGSSSPTQTERSEPGSHTALKAVLATGLIPNHVINSTATGLLPNHVINNSASGMKNTLFDEGIRIAQQYGMCDFANELKTLQGSDVEEQPDDQPDFISSMENGVKHRKRNGVEQESSINVERGSPEKEDITENSRDSSGDNIENGFEPDSALDSPDQPEVETQHIV